MQSVAVTFDKINNKAGSSSTDELVDLFRQEHFSLLDSKELVESSGEFEVITPGVIKGCK